MTADSTDSGPILSYFGIGPGCFLACLALIICGGVG
jgi:hypothetical protein